MKKILIAGLYNWRTTLIGLVEAIAFAAWPIIKGQNFNIRTEWPYLVMAILAAARGVLSKDAHVKQAINNIIAGNAQ